LKLKYDEDLLPNFAFNSNFRRYNMKSGRFEEKHAAAAEDLPWDEGLPEVRRCSLAPY
jgi:hypothetical protein